MIVVDGARDPLFRHAVDLVELHDDHLRVEPVFQDARQDIGELPAERLAQPGAADRHRALIRRRHIHVGDRASGGVLGVRRAGRHDPEEAEYDRRAHRQHHCTTAKQSRHSRSGSVKNPWSRMMQG